MSKQQVVLVTGGAGFIGSNLCHYWNERSGLAWKPHVVAVDALFKGSNLDNLKDREGEFVCDFEQVDLADRDALAGVFYKYSPDMVVHLAAESHVDRSLTSQANFWRSNVTGTENLMSLCREFGVGRVINQITDEVYGEMPGEAKASEGDVFSPGPPYACSKAGQYFVGKSYWNAHQLPVISTFPVNVFGPRQWPEKIIPKFVTLLMEGKKVPLMASTHFERDWLPVFDLCRAFDMLLWRGDSGEDYNIGADNHHTNIDLTHKLLDLCGRDESYIEIVPDRATHDCRYALDSSKIHELGWRPLQQFDNYLQYTVEWYRNYYA